MECHAALARGTRDQRLTRDQLAAAVAEVDRRWVDLSVVELDSAVAVHAGGLARDQGLRAADAIHLASALAVEAEPREVTFACWDRRLWNAARALGFLLVPEIGP